MPRYVALFRGINVGKAKRIAMADLRELLATLGYTDVATLLNSGNAVFTAAKTMPNAKLAARIRAAVRETLGVDAHVVVKSEVDIAAIAKGNTLQSIATNPSRLLVVMTDDDESLVSVKPLAKQLWGEEKVHVGAQAAYLWCANGILESRAAAVLLGKLGNTQTTRNWATLGKIHAKLAQKP
jgi:uncharacterized protein (DUF1697 family)